MSLGIYISYRRDDASFLAGRLYERLLKTGNKVFMDPDRSAHGEDLIRAINKAIESSDILIAVIGKDWLTSEPENLDDHVYLELAAATNRNIPVIPVPVDGVSLPRYHELSDALKDLLRFSPGFPWGSATDGAAPQEEEEAHRNVLLMCRWLLEEGLAEDAARAYDAVRLFLTPLERPQSAIFEINYLKERLEGLAAECLALILDHGNFSNEAVHRRVNVKGESERTEVNLITAGEPPFGETATSDSKEFRVKHGSDQQTYKIDSDRYPVDCTVFAPDRVQREQTRLLQAVLYAPRARIKAEAAAKRFDPEATQHGYRSLVLDAPIGTTFAFDVEIEGFVFRERTDALLWTARQPQAATFRFDVPKDCKLGQHVGVVRISQDGAPVGRITFQIEVVLEARGSSQQPAGKEARHDHACFFSYSSLDRAEMLKRAQGIRATGLETFIDVLTLRPGDVWNPKIFEAIDECDLFVLIWSTNARDSEWVKTESHYALSHYLEHGTPDFIPIPVEGPPIASVPQDLQAYHFNDELLGQIRAAELEMLARKSS
jgi:TIR domain